MSDGLTTLERGPKACGALSRNCSAEKHFYHIISVSPRQPGLIEVEGHRVAATEPAVHQGLEMGGFRVQTPLG
jgi:hypothetical protein